MRYTHDSVDTRLTTMPQLTTLPSTDDLLMICTDEWTVRHRHHHSTTLYGAIRLTDMYTVGGRQGDVDAQGGRIQGL